MSDIQQRINSQTFENLKNRYEVKTAEVQAELERERALRKAETEEADILFSQILEKMDILLDFIAQCHDGIPAELEELIGERQEQRIARNLPPSDFVNEGVKEGDLAHLAGMSVLGRSATDGQVLRASGGKLSWGSIDLADSDVKSSSFEPKSLARIRDEVKRLIALKE